MGYDRAEQLRTTTAVIGRPIESHNELTTDEASKVIEYQNGLEP